MTGEYDLCQVIAHFVRQHRPRHVRIATLCYNKRNASELLGILEEMPALRLTILVSAFFTGHNKETHEWFVEELQPHTTARIGQGRSHCKVACFDLADGDGLVLEGSANLRTNKNREQIAAIRDRQLHDWHAAWIDAMVQASGEIDTD